MRSTITKLRDLASLRRRLSRLQALRVAEAQANFLLRVSGVTEAPVSEEVITGIQHIQVERVEAPSEAFAAALWSHGRWLILLNGAMTRGRQRWSLAHELKHIRTPGKTLPATSSSATIRSVCTQRWATLG